MRRKSLSDLLTPPRGFELTKSGKIFFVFLFAIILTAMATGNNLLFLILACLLAFMIVSGIESEMNIRHLDVERGVPSEIYARRPGIISYTVRNQRRNSERLVLHDDQRSAPRDSEAGLPGQGMGRPSGRILRRAEKAGTGAGLKLAVLSRGIPEGIQQEEIFTSRGRHRLGRVKVSTTYPYGLFLKSISFDLDEEILVFPEPVPLIDIASYGPSGESWGKEHDSISHVRPYAPGDPLSSVVWKKQHNGLVSRVFQGGGGMGTLIVIRPGGDIEQKLGMATFLILELWKSRLRFGVSVNTYFSGMGTSKTHKIEILKVLATLEHIIEPAYREFPGEGHVVTI